MIFLFQIKFQKVGLIIIWFEKKILKILLSNGMSKNMMNEITKNMIIKKIILCLISNPIKVKTIANEN